MCTNACKEKGEASRNASGRGYWVYTCSERPQGRLRWLCRVPLSIYSWRGGMWRREEEAKRGMYLMRRRGLATRKKFKSMHPSEPSRIVRKWRVQAQLNHHWSWWETAEEWNKAGSNEVVSESSQNPLSSGRRRKRARQWKSNVPKFQ